MKKLITDKTIAALKENGQSVLYIDENTLITPSAKDAIRNSCIKVVKGDEFNVEGTHVGSCSQNLRADASCTQDYFSGNIEDIDCDTIVETIIRVLNEKGLLDDFLG